MDWAGSGQGPVVGIANMVTETYVSLKKTEFLDLVIDGQLLKNTALLPAL